MKNSVHPLMMRFYVARSPASRQAEVVAATEGGAPAVEWAHLDDVAGVGRLDEEPAADVDPDVMVAGRTAEEDEVGGLKAVQRHRVAQVRLQGRGVRQGDAELGEDVGHEPRAVEAVRRCSAEDVGDAQ